MQVQPELNSTKINWNTLQSFFRLHLSARGRWHRVRVQDQASHHHAAHALPHGPAEPDGAGQLRPARTLGQERAHGRYPDGGLHGNRPQSAPVGARSCQDDDHQERSRSPPLPGSNRDGSEEDVPEATHLLPAGLGPVPLQSRIPYHHQRALSRGDGSTERAEAEQRVLIPLLPSVLAPRSTCHSSLDVIKGVTFLTHFSPLIILILVCFRLAESMEEKS